MNNKAQKILISACLLGEYVRYDGGNSDIRDNKLIKKLLNHDMLIPICPEVLGGLNTPRVAVELKAEKAINKNGIDKTIEFKKGANIALHVAQANNIKIAIMKSKSPSCGSDNIYDGTFSKSLIKGDGITVKTLKKHNIKIFTENDLNELESILSKTLK